MSDKPTIKSTDHICSHIYPRELCGICNPIAKEKPGPLIESQELQIALGNIRLAATAMRNIVISTKQGIRHSISASERADLDKTKARVEAKKRKLRTAFNARNEGKTFTEIGEMLGVTRARAMAVFKEAESINKAGRLFARNV